MGREHLSLSASWWPLLCLLNTIPLEEILGLINNINMVQITVSTIQGVLNGASKNLGMDFLYHNTKKSYEGLKMLIFLSMCI